MDEKTQEIVLAFQQLGQAENSADLVRVVSRNPCLLSFEADALLGNAIEFYASQKNNEALESTREFRGFLRACRARGIEAAVAESERQKNDWALLSSQQSARLSNIHENYLGYRRTNDLRALSHALETWQQTFEDQILEGGDTAAMVGDIVIVTGVELYEAAFDISRRLELLDQAIRLQAMLMRRGRPETWATRQTRYGFLHRLRFQHTGKIADIDEAIAVYSAALEGTDTADPYYCHTATMLSATLTDRYAYNRQREDLTRAAQIAEAGIASAHPAAAELILGKNQLAWALLVGFEESRDLCDWDRAISLLEQALERAGEESSHLSTLTRNLSYALHCRYQVTSNDSELEKAVELARRATETSTDCHTSALALSMLATCLTTRDKSTIPHLEQAASAWRRALAASAGLGAISTSIKRELAEVLISQYKHSGEVILLNESLQLLHSAEPELEQESSEHNRNKLAIARLFRERYLALTNDRDIQLCLKLAEEVCTAPNVHPHDRVVAEDERLWCLILLADGARLKQEFEAAIQHAWNILEKLDETSDEWRAIASTLTSMLVDRYLELGTIEDLNTGIDLLERALRRRVRDGIFLSNLGRILLHRYMARNRVVDLERAIEALQQVQEANQEDRQSHAGILNNLALALFCRSSIYESEHDLREAAAALKRAISAIGERSRWATIVHDNYSKILVRLHHLSGDTEALSQAILASLTALRTCPANSPDLSMVLSSLASAYYAQFLATRNQRFLDEAVNAAREAVENGGARSSRLAEIRIRLMRLLRERHQTFGSEEDLLQAQTLYKDSIGEPEALSTLDGLMTGREWGDWAYERSAWADAAAAYEVAYTALWELLDAQADQVSKDVFLMTTQALPQRYALVLCKQGKFAEAVQVLEAGLCRSLAESLQADDPEIETLNQEGYSTLVTELRSARSRLREKTNRTHLSLIEGFNRGQYLESLEEPYSEVRSLLKAIRALPGRSNFCKGESFQDIAGRLQHLPDTRIVYLVTADILGFALIVNATGPPIFVPLPDLKLETLLSAIDPYFKAYDAWRSSRVEDDCRSAWMQELDKLTDWLWRAAMGDILKAVGPAKELVLIPAGMLNLLPLHAAWEAAPNAPCGRRYLIDLLEIRYSPNAAALPTNPPAWTGFESGLALLIGDPAPTTAPALPSAREEVKAIASYFPRHQELLGRSATRDAVMTALSQCDVAHFACHAASSLDHPLDSFFLLANDETLDLGAILANVGGRRRLAVLAACETAVLGVKIPNENVSLATGLIRAGTTAVVASSWSVFDTSASILMQDFYRLWRGTGREPADALRQAQLRLREGRMGLSDFTHPIHWAAFRYVGA
jgi:tetratricopeptide (TPR) repeat protein